MKKLIPLAITFSLCTFLVQAQNEIELKDLKTPVVPALSLLDFAPKVIESPGTIKALTTSLVFNAALTGGIPKNFAFEVAPYWFFKHPNMNVYKYYGLGTINHGKDGPGQDNLSFKYKPDIFYGLRSTSISIGSVFKDSAKAHPINANYLSYALRSNIINIKDARINKKLTESIGDVNLALQNVLADAIKNCAALTDSARLICMGNFIAQSKDSVLKKARDQFANLIDVRPVFSVDFALGSSNVFANNNFSDRQSYRSGGWITMAYQMPLVSRKSVNKNIDNLINSKNYLNLFGLVRRLNEKKTTDFKTFNTQSLLDFGGRLELEVTRFSISVESIRRINNTDKNFNSTRTVGIFQYRVNDRLYLLGSFGKDFGDINNLVSLLGLNWGFGESALNKSFQ